jgi:hypothetical protein
MPQFLLSINSPHTGILSLSFGFPPYVALGERVIGSFPILSRPMRDSMPLSKTREVAPYPQAHGPSPAPTKAASEPVESAKGLPRRTIAPNLCR